MFIIYFLHLPRDDYLFFHIFLWMITTFFQFSYGWLHLFPHLPMDDHHFFPICLWMIASFSTSSYAWSPIFFKCFYGWRPLWLFQKITKKICKKKFNHWLQPTTMREFSTSQVSNIIPSSPYHLGGIFGKVFQANDTLLCKYSICWLNVVMVMTVLSYFTKMSQEESFMLFIKSINKWMNEWPTTTNSLDCGWQ